MALTRTTAEIDNILTLRATFRRPLSDTLFDPNDVSQVRILDTDGATVLETIAAADITNVSTGVYEVSSVAANYDAAGVYSDEWTWQDAQGDANTVTVLTTVVKDLSPSFNMRTNAVVGRGVILYKEFRRDVAAAVAAIGTIATTGNPGNNETFTLTDADGTAITYVIKTGEATVDGTKDGDNVIIGVSGAAGSAAAIGDRFRAAIKASELKVTVAETASGQMTLTQNTAGVSGNTAIDMSGVATTTATNFVGGRSTDNVLYAPATLAKVEILDIDGTTVLATDTTPVNQSVGVYYTIVSGTLLDALGTYKDKWYFTVVAGESQTSETGDVVVKARLGDSGTGSGAYKVQVNVTDSSTSLAVHGAEVLASDPADQRLLSATTDSSGKAFFYMDPGTYTFSVRDPINTTYVFSENHKSLTVKGSWDSVPDTANPNILAFNVKYFAPDWSSATALAAADLCLVTGKFADLKGNTLRNVRVRIVNKYVPNITSTYAILGDNLLLTSDSSGQVSAYLVRGAEIAVTIEGTGITRHITVPSAATGDLVSLVGAGQDIFTIAVDNTATVPARVL